MRNNGQWLFIEPYVHLLLRQNRALFYNTLSGEILELLVNETTAPLIRQLEDPGNGYVIPLSHDQATHKEIRSLISNLRKGYFGDTLDAGWSDQRPVNITPLPFVRHPLQLKQGEKKELTPSLDPRHYIQEITFVIATGPSGISEPYQYAPFQFSYPEFHSDTDEWMPFSLFHTILEELSTYTPTLIHVTGTHLFRHPAFGEMTTTLQRVPFEKKYHLHLAHWDAEILLPLLAEPHTTIALYITFPVDTGAIALWIEELPGEKIRQKLEFNVIVSSPEEFRLAMEISQIPGIEHLYFKPFFTGENLDFFREYVFVSENDIREGKPSQTEILSRISINGNDMGKFTILPSGTAFANLNDPLLGTMPDLTLLQLVEEEIIRGKSWKRTRKEVSPCSDCRYQFLCPPISSYEIFMERYNFCDVVPTPATV